MNKIRNFCIIAHIDHGKAPWPTGCWRYKTVEGKEMKSQVLDSMDLERARHYIKSHAIQMGYEFEGEDYTLNLVNSDTLTSHTRCRVLLLPAKVHCL